MIDFKGFKLFVFCCTYVVPKEIKKALRFRKA